MKYVQSKVYLFIFLFIVLIPLNASAEMGDKASKKWPQLFKQVRLIEEHINNLEIIQIKGLQNQLEDLLRQIEEIKQTVKYLPLSKRTELCYKINQLCGSNNPSLMLTMNQILALHQQGMEIGGHTMNHPILSTLTCSDVEYEVEQNKKDLENIINAPIRFFAYPNGKLTVDYLPEHAEIIKKCGYEAALTMNKGGIDSKADLYQLPRFTPWDNTPFKFFLRMFSSYFYDYSD